MPWSGETRLKTHEHIIRRPNRSGCTKEKMWEREKEPALAHPAHESRAAHTHMEHGEESASWFLIHRVALICVRGCVSGSGRQAATRPAFAARLWLSWGQATVILKPSLPPPPRRSSCAPAASGEQRACARGEKRQPCSWFRERCTSLSLVSAHTRTHAMRGLHFFPPLREGSVRAGGALADVASLHLTPRLCTMPATPPSVHLLALRVTCECTQVCECRRMRVSRKRTCINLSVLPSAALFFAFRLGIVL